MIYNDPPPPEPHPIVVTRLDNPRVQEHLTWLKTLIRRSHPNARFNAYEAIEPAEGVYLEVYLSDYQAEVPEAVRDHQYEALDREGVFPLPREATTARGATGGRVTAGDD